jgi:transcriptional regulator with XRE-family HTH domain
VLIAGEIDKEGVYYGASIEPVGAYGTGRTRRAACNALIEMVHAIAAFHRPLAGFKASVTDTGGTTIYLSSNDPARLLSLLLRQQRTTHQLSLADVAAATRARSRNGYAQYEHGDTDPSIAKLQAMLDVVAPDLVLAVIPRAAQVIAPEVVRGDERELDALLRNPSPTNIAAFKAKAPAKRPKRAS